MFKFLFPQRRLVTVYLTDGHVLQFSCTKFETTKDVTGGGYFSYSAEGVKGKALSFCPNAIIAWESQAVYF